MFPHSMKDPMGDNRCKTCLAVDPSVGTQKDSKIFLHAVSWSLVGALRGGKGQIAGG